MDVLGDMLLARAVLAQYQNAHPSGCNKVYPFLDVAVCFPLPYEYRYLALPFLFTFLDNGMEKRNEFVLHQLFGNIVQRTELHALHCRMHFGIVGHNNERLPFVIDTHPFQQFDAFPVRQTQVSKNYIVIVSLYQSLSCR